MATETTAVTRAELYALVDALPDAELPEAKRYLTGLNTTDPVLRSMLLAPLEDEELSPEEEAALAEAHRRRESGEARYISDEELARELGG
jgi:hypothetical protein